MSLSAVKPSAAVSAVRGGGGENPRPETRDPQHPTLNTQQSTLSTQNSPPASQLSSLNPQPAAAGGKAPTHEVWGKRQEDALDTYEAKVLGSLQKWRAALAGDDPKPRNLKPAARNPRPEMLNLKPEIRNPRT